MIRLLYLLLVAWLLSAFGQTVLAQTSTGEIKGRVTDAETGEELPFANVVLKQGGAQKDGTQTDLDGYYKFSALQPGRYDVEVSYVGYATKRITDVVVQADKITFQNFKLSQGQELQEVVVQEYSKPLFEQDQTTTGGTLTREEVDNIATRSVNQIASTTAGAYSGDGGTPNIKGSRNSGTVYVVDGIRVRNLTGIPQSSIEQVSTITGGVPARYGDAVGGVVSVTTRGPSAKYTGSVELISSQLTDPYNTNILEATVGGPILTKYKGTDSANAKLGFFISGNINYQGDDNPSATDVPQVKDEVFQDIQDEPLTRLPGSNTLVPKSSFITDEDLNFVDTHPNNEQLNYNFSGKLDYQIAEGLNLTGGFQAGRQDGTVLGREGTYTSSVRSLLFNSQNFPERTDFDYRGYLRFTQNFPSSKESSIKNAYYQIQVDYNVERLEFRHPNHEDNIFKYGHAGYFTEYQGQIREDITNDNPLTINTPDGQQLITSGSQVTGLRPDSIGFAPSPHNTDLTAYNEQIFGIVGSNTLNRENVVNLTGPLSPSEREEIPLSGFVQPNGFAPTATEGLWYSYGTQWFAYRKERLDQFTANANASATISDHDIQFGIQYEQRTRRFYEATAQQFLPQAPNVWQLMDQLTNQQFSGFNTDAQVNPEEFETDENGDPIVVFPREVNPDAQTTFDANLREELRRRGLTDAFGNPITERTQLNVDQYDPEVYSLSLFSPDELFNNGNEFVEYYGYDYLGEEVGQQSFSEFLQNEEERLISPLNPVYVAGYIQDKFSFRDLIFRVGLRVDRFDANRQVLKDPYSLFPVQTVSDLRGNPATSDLVNNVPSNIGDDWVAYVDDPLDPSRVVGYRSGDVFYTPQGNVTESPTTELNNGNPGFGPAVLVEDETAKISADAFEDYEPQTNFLPRISFSFPISENSNFYANYDVLTQRPQGRNRATVFDYFFLQENRTGVIDNPALQPQRRTNYEVGFKQKLNTNSALSLQMFYGEIRDMIQVQRVNAAYLSLGSPLSGYTTFGNIDFGTVKGLTASYDLRRSNTNKNLQMQINYTLQFADGTGSNTTSQFALINADQPNLRILNPLSFDVRHNVVSTFDFRYQEGSDYNGPIVGDGTQLLKNTGLNIIFNATSGEPYSGQSNVTQEAAFGVAQRSQLEGDINGSRLPWRVTMDAKLDKRISFALGSKNDNEQGEAQQKSKNLNLRLYLWVQNVFDANNIRRVYRFTGLPDDDGFLTSSEGQQTINGAADPQAFVDLYEAKQNTFARYTLPRRIRLGAVVLF